MGPNIRNLIYGNRKEKIITGIFLIIFVTIWIGISLNFESKTLMIISNSVLLVFPIIIGYGIIKAKRFFRSIDSEKLTNIEKELDNPLVNVPYHYALTDNYIISLEGKIGIIKYSDIISMYKKTKIVGSKYASYNTYLVLTTKDNQYEFKISSTALTINYTPINFSEIIKQKNPNVIIEEDKGLGNAIKKILRIGKK